MRLPGTHAAAAPNTHNREHFGLTRPALLLVAAAISALLLTLSNAAYASDASSRPVQITAGTATMKATPSAFPALGILPGATTPPLATLAIIASKSSFDWPLFVTYRSPLYPGLVHSTPQDLPTFQPLAG